MDINKVTAGQVQESLITTVGGLIEIGNMPVGEFRDIFPVDPTSDWSVEAFRSWAIEYTGMADIIGDYARDLPAADVGFSEKMIAGRVVGISYSVSRMEAARSSAGVIDIGQARLRAALRGMELRYDKIAFEGSKADGLHGLYKNTLMPTYTLPNGGGGTSQWTTKSPQEIMTDLSFMVASVKTATGNEMRVKPDQFLIAESVYDYVAGLSWSSDETKSVLSVVIENLVTQGIISSGAQIKPLRQLEEAGTGDTPVAIAITSNVDYLAYRLPISTDILNTQEFGIHFRTPIIGYTAGLDVRVPQVHGIFEGI